ncbi:MAG: hypothetical protein XD50_0432 [Clostridia bacterium 41_269]|nr:MAG: hypothetical protein XD50_0432 [Clostridia bacterium 41_269]
MTCGGFLRPLRGVCRRRELYPYDGIWGGTPQALPRACLRKVNALEGSKAITSAGL